MNKKPRKKLELVRHQKYEKALDELVRAPDETVIERLRIRKYDVAGHIPAEVLVSLFRRNWIGCSDAKKNSTLTKAITSELERRTLSWLDKYFYQNNNLGGIVSDVEEASAEIAEPAWKEFLRPSKPLTFPECHFGKFLERRALDYWEGLTAKKRSMVRSFSEVLPRISESDDDPDEDPAQFFETLREEDTPESKAERRELYARARRALRTELTEDEQTAIILSIEMDLPWTSSAPGEPSVCAHMKVDEDRARYLARRGLAKLKGVMK